jgi:hypothetical protein
MGRSTMMIGMSGKRIPGPPPPGGGISVGEIASTPWASGICAIFSPGRPSVTSTLPPVMTMDESRATYTIV